MTAKPRLEWQSSSRDVFETQRARDAFKLVCAGAIVSSTAYQLMVFAAAALLGVRSAMLVAIATAGVTYLSFLAQVSLPRPPRAFVTILVGASILLGTVAGGLLVGFAILG